MKRSADDRRLKALEARRGPAGLRAALTQQEARLVVEDPEAADLAHLLLEARAEGRDTGHVERALAARLRTLGGNRA